MRIPSGYLGLFVAAFVLLVVAGGQTTFTSGGFSRRRQRPLRAAPDAELRSAAIQTGRRLNCGLQQDLLGVSWTGQDGAELRIRFAIDNAKPVVRDIAVRKQGGQWAHARRESEPRVSRRERHPPILGPTGAAAPRNRTAHPRAHGKGKVVCLQRRSVVHRSAAPAGGRAGGRGRRAGRGAAGAGDATRRSGETGRWRRRRADGWWSQA